MLFTVLYEDNHLLVVNKPAGLATMGVAADKPSLLGEAKEYIKAKYGKPGNVYLGVVSRLDAPVTGVLVLARTSKAASRLTDQFRRGKVHKTYWALVEEPPEPLEGRLVDWVRHDDRHRRMHIAAKTNADAKEARLSYRTLRQLDRCTLVEVELETGRKHQIRLQFSHKGLPLLGDRKYGSNRSFAKGIALHARELRLEHPVQNGPLMFTADLPDSWSAFGAQ